MKSKLLHDDGKRTFAVVFDAGDEVMSGLLDLARDQSLGASHFTAIGALSDAEVGYFDPPKKDYERIRIGEQVEVLALVGDITLNQGEPMVHAHLVVASRDGTARGGHLFEAHVRPTLEVFLTESPSPLDRRKDEASGLALIDV